MLRKPTDDNITLPPAWYFLYHIDFSTSSLVFVYVTPLEIDRQRRGIWITQLHCSVIATCFSVLVLRVCCVKCKILHLLFSPIPPSSL